MVEPGSSAALEAMEAQEVLTANLQQIISNYKKDSEDRKNLAYFEERLRRLEAAWKSFKEKDIVLRSMEELKDHRYFAKKVYESILELYKKYKAHFTEQIQIYSGVLSLSTSSKATLSEVPIGEEQMAKVKVDESGKIHTLIRRQRIQFEAINRLLSRLSFENLTAAYVSIKSDTVKRMWMQIENVNLNIHELTSDPCQYGYDIERFQILEDQVQETLIELNGKMQSTSLNNAEVKLPTITLPKFDGDYEKWTQFRDLFRQMVHEQPMPECQKLWYLKANVTGEAEKLIRGLLTSSENYAAAWKTLEDRYNNKRLLIAILVNKLLSQPNHAAENPSATTIKNLHDVTKECLLGITNLGISTTGWDPILIHLLVKKLDKASHTLFEQSLENPREPPTLMQLLSFLETRFQSLENLSSRGKSENQNKSFSRALASTIVSCVQCQGSHPIFNCKEFVKLAVGDRLKTAKKNNICLNCLKSGHFSSSCTSRGCTKCNKKHNTLLHFKEYHSEAKTKELGVLTGSSNTTKTMSEKKSPASLTTTTRLTHRGYVLLGTALIQLSAENGKKITCRAVLDSGSQINVVTERIVRKLNLPVTSVSMQIQGIGNGRQNACKRTSLYLQSGRSFSERLEAYVLPTIISQQPTQVIDASSWKIPEDIILADARFHTPGQIDVLLGAEFHHQILRTGQIKLNDGLPVLQNTVFGWVISGKIDEMPLIRPTCGISTEEEELNRIMSKFWQLEEVEPTKPQLTGAEKLCETHFNQTTERTTDGRFVVKLPFKDSPNTLGESKDIAMRRFLALERRLQRDPELRAEYSAFMNEYLDLGHMQETRNVPKNHYFVPHHCVIKPESTSTRLRVVFDASAKTTTQLSLNDILHSGPSIQDEMWIILLRFRLPRFVFSADIQKMYRQIWIHEDHRTFHLVLWRNNPNEPIKIFELLTVTYGDTSAPYLAMRCLQQLALERVSCYPLGAEVIHKNFYVDNAIAGANTVAETLEMQNQVTTLLNEAGFKLRKWSSNHPSLLERIPLDDREKELDLSSANDEAIKILGLAWQPKGDIFRIKVQGVPVEKVTRRNIASELARLFDPLGLLGPIVVTAKIIVQQLVKQNLEWDAPVPPTLHNKWLEFRKDLEALNNIHIPRHVFADKVPMDIQFHVFSDASENAYGAAMYVRSEDKFGTVVVRLLCAKSRIAPIKMQTIPRLELCAAKLAADLTQKVTTELNLSDKKITFWTDSQIVLSWINSQSCSYKTFVANRISSILEKTLPEQWRHVRSTENPADALSRGTTPNHLVNNHLWFYGPLFLHGSHTQWPPKFTPSGHCELERKRSALAITEVEGNLREDNIIDTIDHHNSFRRLQRIVAYMLKFKNQRNGPPAQSTMQQDYAIRVIIRNMQKHSRLDEEIQYLTKHNKVDKNSRLVDYTPFLDKEGILRVGGRLAAADLPYDTKYPMVLPCDHPLTRLLMTTIHNENLHVGQLALLAKTRQRFWPIKGKAIARGVIK